MCYLDFLLLFLNFQIAELHKHRNKYLPFQLFRFLVTRTHIYSKGRCSCGHILWKKIWKLLASVKPSKISFKKKTESRTLKSFSTRQSIWMLVKECTLKHYENKTQKGKESLLNASDRLQKEFSAAVLTSQLTSSIYHHLMWAFS